MIVPAKLWRSLAGGGVRELLLGTTALLQVHDLTLADTVFDASVYPSTFVSRCSSPTGSHPLAMPVATWSGPARSRIGTASE